MNNITNILSSHQSRELFALSPQPFFFGAIALIVFFSIILGLLLWKKGKIFTILSALIFGAIGMTVFLSINGTIHIDSGTIEQTNSWLNLVGIIFVTLISVILPLYIYVVVVNFIISENITKIKKKTYGVSFLTLVGLSMFGIFLALLLSPIIIYGLPDSMFNVGFESGGEGEETSGFISFFTDWKLILVMIALAIISGISINLALRTNIKTKEKVRKFIGRILSIINAYFKYLIMMVPFVILTRISMLGLNSFNETGTTLSLMLSYMGVYWLGAIIIFISLFSFNILISTKKLNVREKAKILTDQALTVFASQSTQASLPMTQMTVRKLGACEEISQLTPTLGTIMGMVMCNGFTPMLILILTIVNANNGAADWGHIFLAAAIIIGLTISTSGQGSADYIIVTTAINTLGLTTGIYLGAIMPIQEINERTIRTPNNSLGHVAATLLTEKAHQRFNNQTCDSCEKED